MATALAFLQAYSCVPGLVTWSITENLSWNNPFFLWEDFYMLTEDVRVSKINIIISYIIISHHTPEVSVSEAKLFTLMSCFGTWKPLVDSLNSSSSDYFWLIVYWYSWRSLKDWMSADVAEKVFLWEDLFSCAIFEIKQHCFHWKAYVLIPSGSVCLGDCQLTSGSTNSEIFLPLFPPVSSLQKKHTKTASSK